MTEDEPLERRALDYILQKRLIRPRDHLLAAVSGGPDSTALLHILYNLRDSLKWGQLTVVHFHHGLRGKDSDDDLVFVQGFAQRLGLPFEWERADVAAYRLRERVSLEMAARACRHRFFRDALTRNSADRIALGHTANDQAEEILLRLFRGTGPSGLTGMPPAGSDGIIRPLLFASRREILDYLHRRGIGYREDPSNQEAFCQRNALRLEVLPKVEKHFHHRVVENLCRSAKLVQDEEDFLSGYVKGLWPALCLLETGDRIVLDLLSFQTLHPAIMRRVIRMAVERLQGSTGGIYSVHIEGLCQWAGKIPSGKSMHLPAGLRASREGNELILHKESFTQHQQPPASYTINGPGCYNIPPFRIRLHISHKAVKARPDGFAQPPECAALDADKIQWPLSVRSWNPGDRFHPLGLRGSKKLQDFFTDAKIPRSKRALIPLLCDGEKICWVMGYQLDERAKVTPQTRRVLIVEMERSGLQ